MQKISIVIPYFNDSACLKRALDSVISQSMGFHEIILIDDCSEDSLIAVSILDSYKSDIRNKIHYLRNKKNMNGAYSRNIGIKMATGNYIAFLDADDFWHNDHLLLSLNKLLDKDLDFIFSNVIEIKGSKENIRKVNNPKLLKNKNDILFFSPPQTNSFLIRRSKFIEESIFFDENLRRHQDYQFLIYCINSNIKWDYLDVNTSYYCLPNKKKALTMDYNSMLDFWNKNFNFFTEKYAKKFILGICIDYYFYHGRDNFLKSIKEKDNLQFVIQDFLIKKMICFESDSKRFRLLFKFLHYLKNDQSYFINLIFSKFLS